MISASHTNRIAFSLVAGLALILLVPPAEAGRWGSKSTSSSSSSGSSGSRGSSSWGRKTSGSSWGSGSKTGWGTKSTRTPSRTTTPSYSWGKRSSATTGGGVSAPPRASEADKAAHKKAVQYNSFNHTGSTHGSAESGRAAAVQDFQKKFGEKYTAKYSKQPPSRPEHIPETTTVGGASKPVVYRTENGVGGYYFQNAAGAWVLYSLMRDQSRRDRYMYRHGYDPTGRSYTPGHTSRSSGGGSCLWLVIGLALVGLMVAAGIGAMMYFAAKHARKQPPKRITRRREEVRPAEPAGRDKLFAPTQREYWLQVKPGDTFILKDEQTLELLMKERRAGFAHGESLTVRSVRTITERNKLMKWALAELSPVRTAEGEQVWYVFLKVVDKAFDVRVMYQPADFPAGSRQQMLDAGMTWLFQPPDDENNFRPADLKFTMTIEQTLDNGRTVVYNQKPQGVLFGEQVERPKPSGIPQPRFVAVAEYRADTACENPEVMLLETGGVDVTRRASRDTGGFIALYQGVNVSPTDLELIPV